MKTEKMGNYVVTGLVALNVLLWVLFPPPDTLATSYTGQFIGEVLASSAMILMAIAIVLSTKPKSFEKYFNGLDKMYQTHKQVAMLGFIFLIAHFFVIPDSGELVVGKPVGMLAFAGIILLVFLSVAPRIPLISRFLNLAYDKWRISHKLLGVFYTLGLVHYLMVATISKQTIPGTYMLLMVFIGIGAFLYKQFIAGRVRPKLNYTVSDVTHLNGTSMEIVLQPQGEKLNFDAGQFVFVEFDGNRTLAEPHPFTVSSAPHEPNLRLSIKASGDWTRYLQKNLAVGTTAKVEGSFGRFNYKNGGKEQIWVAGGIGVTPFLSWVRSANGSLPADVDFFYGVGSEGEALFWDEFQSASKQYDNFRPRLQFSSVDGHLSAKDIAEQCQGTLANKHIYMCGPYKMTEGFARTFQKMGVPADQIHFEEFNFR